MNIRITQMNDTIHHVFVEGLLTASITHYPMIDTGPNYSVSFYNGLGAVKPSMTRSIPGAFKRVFKMIASKYEQEIKEG